MAECRRELGLPLEAPVACFAGFVLYDLELALRAFAQARRQLPQARLLLVGPTEKLAAGLLAELDLTDCVLQAGVQPFERMPLYLGAADLLLMPLSDNLMNRARGPIKIGDYIASGRAVLANPVGDLVEIFEAGEIGALVGASPQSYGEAMAGLLQDRDRCAQLGRNARELAEKRYAWKHIAPKLQAIYDRALAGY
jgi:phosphatidylinositol alpha-1,6-mannosyltransferase